MTVRVAIVTTLLVSAFSIEVLFKPAHTLRPVFLLAAVSYGMVLLYAVLDRWLRGTRSFIFTQLVGDALVITLFVHITGGLDSPMSFLYLLPISVASMVLYRNGALIMAAVCYGAYTALILFGAARALIGTGNAGAFEREPGRVLYFLVAHLVAMVAVALLSSYLSERLRLQGRELVERRGAVARLQALNENIIESINSGLITTSLNGRINFINRGGTEILGLPPSQILERDIESVMQLNEGFLHEIRRRLLAKTRFRFENWFGTLDSRRIYLGLAVSNLYDKIGRSLGYIIIFQDLTEIHALEHEVRLKERMAALGGMAAGMAHELRNPMAAISGAVQYLKGEIKAEGETLELMDIILRESQRLDQTIRDFLTFTRPGAFAAKPTDVVRLLQDNIKLLRKSKQFREAHSIVANYAAPRMICDVDANRVKQIFWNLATNALKAMPEGGTLSVDVVWVAAETRVQFSFTDNGVGMNEEQQGLYFQPFNSSFREGTGLGAAIVYRLVEEHRGNIHLESNVGRGTVVRIDLPRHQARQDHRAAAPTVRWAFGGEVR